MVVLCHCAGMWGCGHLQEKMGWGQVTGMAEKPRIFNKDSPLPSQACGPPSAKRGSVLYWCERLSVSSKSAQAWLPLYEISSLPWSHLRENPVVAAIDNKNWWGLSCLQEEPHVCGQINAHLRQRKPNSSFPSPCSDLNNSETASLGVSWAGWGTNQGPLSRALLNAQNLKWNTKCEFQVWTWCIRIRGGWQPLSSLLHFGSRY